MMVIVMLITFAIMAYAFLLENIDVRMIGIAENMTNVFQGNAPVFVLYTRTVIILLWFVVKIIGVSNSQIVRKGKKVCHVHSQL